MKKIKPVPAHFMKYCAPLIMLFFLSCSPTEKKATPANAKPVDAEIKQNNTKIILTKLDKLFIAGDFDGDGIKDTIYQHNFSKLHHAEIDSAPDPYKNEWDTIVNWYDLQESDVYLAFNKKGGDTLHLGTAQGLYCLLNLGDINADGKDEIALVIDFCDDSNLNSCKIFSFCKSKWVQLKEFDIRESAFEFTSDTIPRFTSIEGYLEKQNNTWVYKDIKAEDDGEKMKTLKLKRCN